MHPAPSIIVFTVLSGLGLGMIAWIGAGMGTGHLFGWVAGPMALVIAGIGGLASAGHLGRPDRAWRAFSQWRSSWLSREACLMVAAMAAFAAYLGLWLLLDLRLAPLGWMAAGLALATVYATAMIYAQLRTVPAWSATPTPVLFLALALSGGLLATSAAIALAGGEAPVWRPLTALAVTAGIATWWQTRAAGATRGLHGSSLDTATGLAGLGHARLLEPPHTGSNYLLREMAFQIGRNRAFQIRKIAALMGFVLPLALTLLTLASGGWILVFALIAHVMGTLALRWLFFAEAKHVQAIYYGRG